MGRIEHVMQRDRQFDDAEAGPQVASGYRHSVNGFGPQLIGYLPELALVQSPQIGRGLNGIQERRRGGHDRNIVIRWRWAAEGTTS
jgi:hypothetical protein